MTPRRRKQGRTSPKPSSKCSHKLWKITWGNKGDTWTLTEKNRAWRLFSSVFLYFFKCIQLNLAILSNFRIFFSSTRSRSNNNSYEKYSYASADVLLQVILWSCGIKPYVEFSQISQTCSILIMGSLLSFEFSRYRKNPKLLSLNSAGLFILKYKGIWKESICSFKGIWRKEPWTSTDGKRGLW